MINNLDQAISILNNHSKILVAGPQRSGTTIASKILSKRLDLQCFDEKYIKINRIELFQKIIDNEDNFVLQCPDMSYYLHHIGDREDIFIVFMTRDIYDILMSQKRIRWKDGKSKKKYLPEFNIELNDIPISVIRYYVWNKYQKNKIKNKIELQYECLKTDELWVDKKLRVDFRPKQTKINQYALDDLTKRQKQRIIITDRKNSKNKGFKKI